MLKSDNTIVLKSRKKVEVDKNNFNDYFEYKVKEKNYLFINENKLEFSNALERNKLIEGLISLLCDVIAEKNCISYPVLIVNLKLPKIDCMGYDYFDILEDKEMGMYKSRRKKSNLVQI